MRLLSWSSEWDPEEGIVPADAQEIDFYASADELRELAKFFTELAEKAERSKHESFERTIDFGDSKTKDTTPIHITVKYAREKF